MAYAEAARQNVDEVKATLQSMQAELDIQKQCQKEIEKKSHMTAGMYIGVGFMGCLAQLTGFYFGIYHIADWNFMEPLTFIARK